jgi:hypothetical protein
MPAECSFVPDHVRLRLATRVWCNELRDSWGLRINRTKAEHGAATIGMPVAGLMLIVAIARRRHIVRMCGPACISMMMLVPMPGCRRAEFMGTLHRQTGELEGGGHCERGCHRRKQVGDGDKPPPASAPPPSPASHLTTSSSKC